MTDLAKLIADLESAEAGSRELDARIWAELDDRSVRQIDNLIMAKSRVAPHDECRLGTIDPGVSHRHFQIAASMPPIPHYTTSLDAALTLVPKGWVWGKSHTWQGTFMECYPPRWIGPRDVEDIIYDEKTRRPTGGNTEDARSLCIAALRAMQAEKEAGFVLTPPHVKRHE